MKKIILATLAILIFQNLHASDECEKDIEPLKPSLPTEPKTVSKYGYPLEKFIFDDVIKVGLVPYSVKGNREYTCLKFNKIIYTFVHSLKRLNSPQSGLWYCDNFPNHHVIAFDEHGIPQVINNLYKKDFCSDVKDKVEPNGDVYVQIWKTGRLFKLFSLRAPAENI